MRRELVPLYGKGEAEAIIRIIFEHLKGWRPVDVAIHADDELNPFVGREADAIIERLKKGEPIQYIVGEAYFFGYNFHVEPGVLIPRPETQELVDAIVDWNPESDLRVLDIGTGSGCIAVSLALALKFADVEGIDVSPAAVKIAADNAMLLKGRARFSEKDVFEYDPAADSFDIIVSNPPYIDESERAGMDRNVLDYEPATALFVPDSDPLRFYRRICDLAGTALKPGGRLYFEINPRHAEQLKRMMSDFRFVDVEIWRDMHGKYRFAKGIKPMNDDA